ncbi:MAG TPA: 3-phosphoserine/phosphohydroxythreonine transaminase [Clostridia bacterium]|nr:3-phosphoserine/phosphohydroxythreonine transaminase [Clostridia bacterium]
MSRVYNFSAGPSVLPLEVLEKAQREMLDYNGSGMSVMEMSHRSSVYQDIIDRAEASLRDIMAIPENYKVLFLTGGASTQFAMIPMNLVKKGKIDIVHTGAWTKAAIPEARKFAEVNIVASSEDEGFTYIPELDKTKFNPDADYFHITTNNTIAGTRFTELPDTGDVDLVADMSSNILSEVYDVSKFALIFAGAQKNMGPAGVTVVIIRDDLIGKANDSIPTMFNYKTHAEKGSMYNTPPTYPIYICGMVFDWIKSMGGVEGIYKRNVEKAECLYNFLDESSMFKGTVRKKDRSLMNIPFVTGNPELDAAFVKGAAARGMVNLKGHRSVGGMRASIYNAMPLEGVKELVSFMKDFESANS